MTIVDRRLQCENCFFRYDDLNRLRLHKRQKEGVCDSYDISNEEQYYRDQNFVYAKKVKAPKEQKIRLEQPVKVAKEPKVRLKVMSSVLNCPHCEITFDLDQDSEATFKLVRHVAEFHQENYIKFR